YPANKIDDCDFKDEERRHIAGLMRVNHSGEVSAQALYQGQAITARKNEVREKLEQAAMEENDHLAWTKTRLQELGDRTSYLNPIWYAGSLAIGACAGIIGDKWNLGFLAETEHQVVEHLDEHLKQLPKCDQRSRAILEQMKIDEAKHATTALEHGGAELPEPIKDLMSLMSKVMTTTTYRL
ncbi:MAG: 2-polyprenyl-3-methyl-6-methoxy-1,4-benzoquinone monooxygenase, partial [Gammaproteobacteria bacterium]|nr:2-polyprenyl-3-methyl-6-methoxy-1,4-benzoquinone monooxygenase [Gammaproteobacteria bacterium]